MLSLYIRLIGSGSVNRLLHQRQGIKQQLYENIDDKTCPFALKHKPFCPERITGEYGTIKYLLVQRRSVARMSVRAISSEDPFVAAFRPCELGRNLLLKFAAARPADHTFLEPRDFVDLHNSAFSGIPEWDVFAEHISQCSQCGEV
jgi:hypothetical protein